jgi:replication initiation protein RepC
MEGQVVTTPFGRRAMTFGMLAAQVRARDIKPGRTIDKWKLYRALCEAKPLLGVTDRGLAVLNALLSFYPTAELSEAAGLVVFPSNAQLSMRSHGMAEQTIRRHLAALVNAGLLTRKDSPNGKRYARKDRAGEIREAFGFSLAPLLARAEEIERLAAEVVAERLHVQDLRERISLCRRDISKLIDAAVAERLPGDWMLAFNRFRDLVEGVPRSPTTAQLEDTLDAITNLRLEVLNQLELQLNFRNTSANPCQNERHIQNSNPESIFDLGPGQKRKNDPLLQETSDQPPPSTADKLLETSDESIPKLHPAPVSMAAGERELKSFPLGLVLQACPEVAAYGPGGIIRNWRDLMTAAIVVKSMLGVSPSAYQEACAVMGPDNAATVMACILERTEQINSAGGYLRDLTRRSQRGEFAIGPMLMSLVRANVVKEKRTG